MTVTTEQLAFEAMTAQVLSVGEADDVGERGEVFTRRWVVELILDLVGYKPERDLASLTAVEPSCGQGAFLVPMVERLVAACRMHQRDLAETADAIRAFDLLGVNAEASRQAVIACLERLDVSRVLAVRLARAWVVKGDFLLHPHRAGTVDFVIGNPPYIRLENVSRSRSAVYRSNFPTMRGRSDIFVGFIECGLRQLRDGGVLGFIVADRWMRNQYGAELRSLVRDGYSIDAVLQLHDVDAFEDRVSAYPAITVVSRRKQGRAVIGDTTRDFAEPASRRFSKWVATGRRPRFDAAGVTAARAESWFDTAGSWPTGSPDQLAIVAHLEARFPALEDRTTDTRVGIGVASGADAVYLTTDTAAVESERLLPVVMAKDLADGVVRWSGTHLVNPWQDGRLVDLREFPRLARHFERHSDRVRSRHVAQKSANRWYRTIDRVEPGLLERPKLLLPDLKSSIHPVLEDGHLYPHHNLYFVTSEAWDLDVLGGLLLSDVANMFVGAYCVKMRGGCLRFQAQYLRRIRLPYREALTKREQRGLASSFWSRDVAKATSIACRLYGIDGLPSSVGSFR